jgi:hypothetical protein
MKAKTCSLSAEARAAASAARVTPSGDGWLFTLAEVVERRVYDQVNRVLRSLGGKWNPRLKGHSFPDGDPSEGLRRVLAKDALTRAYAAAVTGMRQVSLHEMQDYQQLSLF